MHIADFQLPISNLRFLSSIAIGIEIDK